MDNQQIVELFQAIGMPTTFLLLSNNKQYEILIEKITGELKKLNDNINEIQQDK